MLSDAYYFDSETVEVKREQLPRDFEPGNYSVICGRGKEFYNSIGNRRFRVMVSTFLDRYARAESKSKKSQIVLDIVAIIRSAGGGFIKYENGCWWEVGDNNARYVQKTDLLRLEASGVLIFDRTNMLCSSLSIVRK
jgi:hypothetical protein